MKIFQYKNNGGITSDESNLTRLSASVNNGLATVHRKIYFEADADNEDALDILSLDIFPQKYSAHPRHASFKYYGNAQIDPVSENSKRLWVADLEYSSSEPNAKDSDGNTVTGDTPPWKLKPDNIHFSYPETVINFNAAYNSTGQMYDDDGNVLVPVKNSAGDSFHAERSIRDMQFSFTFATKSWKPGIGIAYGNSVNSKEISVGGFVVSAGRGLLLPPECSHITVYEENSTNVKWEYWSVTINLKINTSGLLLNRRFLDVGSRAKFDSIDLSRDAMLQAARRKSSSFSNFTVPASRGVSQICRFRLHQGYSLGNGKMDFFPGGDIIFCGWDQYLYIRKLFLAASTILSSGTDPVMDGLYELQCEQEDQMPLASDGRLLYKAIDGHSQYVSGTKYRTKSFREYPYRDWTPLNLPKKGIDW